MTPWYSVERDERLIIDEVEYVRADLHLGAVADRERLMALLHRLDHRAAADPGTCGMCAKVQASLPSGGRYDSRASDEESA